MQQLVGALSVYKSLGKGTEGKKASKDKAMSKSADK